MGRRLILDTNVLIGYERETIDRAALDADELAVAAVSIAEYRVGIELADTPGRAADRARALAAITSSVDALKSSVTALSANPSAGQIATVTKDAASVVSSVKSFTDATSSQCS